MARRNVPIPSPAREPSEDEVVQLRREHDEAQPARLAQRGVAGGGGKLPHLAEIERAFGPYDVSSIQSHQGGAAAKSCDDLGAEAYATGDHVAFGRSPDLHTAAHEAAHVVQQRGGVQMKGRGRGDAEDHADRVADAVVAGEPADYLLSQMAGPRASSSPAGDTVQLKRALPSGEEGFEKMWDAHPHNYQQDESENTTSDEVRDEQGLPDWMENTCAIRISVMLNTMGETITPAKAKAAGLTRPPTYSKKTKQYYIVAASEMWQYLQRFYRQADVTFPPDGTRYKDAEDFQAAFDATIRTKVGAGKGIVAFDKIFGYGGTGHVDLFDGESLSNAAGWYPCQRLMLWYVSVG